MVSWFYFICTNLNAVEECIKKTKLKSDMIHSIMIFIV